MSQYKLSSFGDTPSQGNLSSFDNQRTRNWPIINPNNVHRIRELTQCQEDCLSYLTHHITVFTILFIDLNQAGPFAQSGIKQTFTAKTSGVLMFDWNF